MWICIAHRRITPQMPLLFPVSRRWSPLASHQPGISEHCETTKHRLVYHAVCRLCKSCVMFIVGKSERKPWSTVCYTGQLEATKEIRHYNKLTHRISFCRTSLLSHSNSDSGAEARRADEVRGLKGQEQGVGVLGEGDSKPQPKSNLVHFGLKIWHLVAAILTIFVKASVYKIMHNFTEKMRWDNILVGGNAWVKWKCTSLVQDTWNLACLVISG